MNFSEEPQGDQRHARHRGGRRRHHSSKRRLLVILGLALAAETVLMVTAFVRMGLGETERLALEISGRKQAEELETLRPQVEKLRREIAELTRSRLPGLEPLEFDKVLAVDREYVRNIVFTLAGKGDPVQYEYKLTTHNGTLNLVHPQVDILFFDHLGIQVGQSRIGVQHDGTPTMDMLERGETRSYSGKVVLSDEVKPEYFRLRIQP